MLFALERAFALKQASWWNTGENKLIAWDRFERWEHVKMIFALGKKGFDG